MVRSLAQPGGVRLPRRPPDCAAAGGGELRDAALAHVERDAGGDDGLHGRLGDAGGVAGRRSGGPRDRRLVARRNGLLRPFLRVLRLDRPRGPGGGVPPVSYTHLTLPTK